VAITAATQLSDFSGFLNPEQSAPIFERAARQSVVQRLARRVPLGANGVRIPVVTSRPTAGWVSEAGQKPASEGSMSLASMDPEKIAAIAVVSAEVLRANPGSYVEQIREDIAAAFAVAFDSAALHGTSTPFDNYVAETTKSVEFGTTAQADGGVYGDLVAGLSLLVDDGQRLTGFAFDDRAEPVLLSGVDTTGRPLFIESPLDETVTAVRPGRLIGRSAFLGEGVYDAATDTLGFGGDWTQIAWGVVGGISYDVSTEATVTIDGSLVSLFEHNLVAIRAEAEYGLVINDVEAFVAYTDAVS
jgi:HK97 family phage major capsid protein